MLIEAGKKYRFETVDSEYLKYDDTEVEVIRPLTDEEADIADVGNMYQVKFNDGYVSAVFEDELHSIK